MKFKRLILIITIVLPFILMTIDFSNVYSKTDETYKGLKLFTDVIELIEKNYVDPVETEKIIHSAIQGMVKALDPHSSFMPPEAFEELQIDTHGEFGGIGIVITIKDNVLTVISPIDGTPAYKQGIKAGDRIIKVDDIPTKDMELWEAVRKMRGQQGTSVKITISREGIKEPFDVEIVRDIIPMESVRYADLGDNYVYVWITNFRDKTTDDLIDALNDLEKNNKNIKGLIFDLRDNPGGLLDQAVQVADLFIDEGTIVSIQGRVPENNKIFDAHKNDSDKKYPMAVLINGGSASASEIVAGALQDHKRAIIIGTSSFGKGSVQTVEALRDGYGLKYTIARYYTPNNRSIQAQGIQPDILVSEGTVEKPPEQAENKMFLKEKDLKNHLEAEPQNENEVQENELKKDDPKKDEPKKDELKKDDPKKDDPKKDELKKEMEQLKLRNEMRHGTLDVKRLLDDVQIRRSLEILKGYSILSERK